MEWVLFSSFTVIGMGPFQFIHCDCCGILSLMYYVEMHVHLVLTY